MAQALAEWDPNKPNGVYSYLGRPCTYKRVQDCFAIENPDGGFRIVQRSTPCAQLVLGLS